MFCHKNLNVKKNSEKQPLQFSRARGDKLKTFFLTKLKDIANTITKKGKDKHNMLTSEKLKPKNI